MSAFFNPVIASITVRATLGRRRALLFAIPAVVLIALTLAVRATHPTGSSWEAQILGDFGFSVLLPLLALIIGTGVLGAEIDDGSAIHLLATPVRRSAVILTKFSVATVLTMIFAAVPELIAALISGGGNLPTTFIGPKSGQGPVTVIQGAAISDSRFAIGLFVGALVGAVIYNAIFVMVSVATTRAIAVGLLYVLIWEVVLANFVSGARLLSVSHYALGIANGFVNDTALNAGLNVTTSVVMGAIVTVVALALAVRLLSSFTLKGEPA